MKSVQLCSVNLFLYVFLFSVPIVTHSADSGIHPVKTSIDYPSADNNSPGLKLIGQIGGPVSDVAVAANYVYLCEGMRLVVIDISDPAHPRDVGVTVPFEAYANGVAVSGEMAYVAASHRGLIVVNVSDPTHPDMLSSFHTRGYAEKIAVVGQYVLIAYGWNGLSIVDASNPTALKEVAHVAPFGYTFDVEVVGETAYLACAGSGLQIIDISNIENPVAIGSFNTPGYAHGVCVSGEYAYIADEWAGVRILNIADKRNPIEVGSYATPGQAFDVQFADNKVYVADAFRGVRVIDVSNPENPTETGFLETEGHAHRLTLSGDRVYVADQEFGCRILDRSDPTNLRLLGERVSAVRVRDVAVSGNYAYLAVHPNFFFVADTSDPTRPMVVCSRSLSDNPGGLVVRDNLAYIICNNVGLIVFDVSVPTDPIKLGEAYHDIPARDLNVQGDYAFVASEGCLEIFDVSDPTNPAHGHSLPIENIVTGTDFTNRYAIVGVAVKDTIAVLCLSDIGVAILDVTNPLDPRTLAFLPDVGFTQEVKILGTYAYISDTSGLLVLDISDPTHPTKVAFAPSSGFAEGVTALGSRAYIADGDAGLAVYDISDPHNPQEIGRFNTLGYAQQVRVNLDQVFIADLQGGLAILSDLPIQDSQQKSPRFVDAHSTETVPGVVSSGKANTQRSLTESLAHNQYTVHRTIPDADSPVLSPARRDGPASSTKRSNVVTQGNILLVTSADDSGSGTLRNAMEHAAPGDHIAFDPTVFPPEQPMTIQVLSALPRMLQGPITIDGSDAGVILDGSLLSQGAAGLSIESDGNRIMGLEIVRFPGSGIDISGNGNVIGGNCLHGSGPNGQGNVISGNNGPGINIRHAGENVVSGNLIGTDRTGTVRMGNHDHGVFLWDAWENRIGGAALGEGNVISANYFYGVEMQRINARRNIVMGNMIGTDITGSVELSNVVTGVGLELKASETLVANNLIVSTFGNCLIINDPGSSYNTVVGNRIGTDITGTIPLSRSNFAGILMGQGSAYNRIGGTSPEDRNIISGNNTGIYFARQGQHGNVVLGNYIGTDATGTKACCNGSGIAVGPDRPMIGGMTPEERNIISGNQQAGVSFCPGVDFAWIAGNYIGTDVTGSVPLGNGTGIGMENNSRHCVQGNTVSGNDGIGIMLGPSSEYNSVLENLVGTDATGSIAVPNSEGIDLFCGASHNEIVRNIISGNLGNGMRISSEWRGGEIDRSTAFNWITGNRVGTDASGANSLPNHNNGIQFDFRAENNLVGGQSEADSNIIRFNQNNGIAFILPHVRFNRITRNTISSNESLGIAYEPNEDAVVVPPVITAVDRNYVRGTCVAPDGSVVEIFCGPDNEGEIYLGSAALANGSFVFEGQIPRSRYVTATVTDLDGNTSAFSLPVGNGVRIVSVEPNNNELAVAHNATISIAFDEPVSGDAANRLVAYSALTGRIPGKFAGEGGNAKIYVPERPFLPADEIEVSVTANAFTGTGGIPLTAPYVWRFRTAAGWGPAAFNLYYRQAVMDTVRTDALAFGDVDGDGDLDLAVSQFEGISAIHLNDGAGHFNAGTRQIGDARSVYFDLKFGDMDGDGDLDLVAASHLGQSAIYFNDGRGQFSECMNFGNSVPVPRMALGDADGNGYLDIAIGGMSASTNTVYFNNGNGRFDRTTSFEAMEEQVRSIIFGDIDNDGDLDLAVGTSGQEDLLYYNNGEGLFPTVRAVGRPEDSGAIVLGDFDGDNELDVCSGTALYCNPGMGIFDNAERREFRQGSTDVVACGDVDGDGDLDVVISPLTLYLNDGTGRFTERDLFGDWIAATTFGDADGDSDLDLVVARNGDARITLYLNESDEPRPTPTPGPVNVWMWINY